MKEFVRAGSWQRPDKKDRKKKKKKRKEKKIQSNTKADLVHPTQQTQKEEKPKEREVKQPKTIHSNKGFDPLLNGRKTERG